MKKPDGEVTSYVAWPRQASDAEDAYSEETGEPFSGHLKNVFERSNSLAVPEFSTTKCNNSYLLTYNDSLPPAGRQATMNRQITVPTSSRLT
jgi:hypothetical protein